MSAPHVPSPPSRVVLEFSDPDAAAGWQTVNDGVMGGVSVARVRRTADGTLVFEGEVSFENNGGFASARTALPAPAALDGAGVTARVRGDGHRFQLRVHTVDLPRGTSYRAHFDTADGEWRDVALPFPAFVATCRGRVVPDAPPLDPRRADKVGFLIGDRQGGPFRLEVQHIGVMP